MSHLDNLPKPRAAQVRGMLLIAFLAVGLDWTVKKMHWWDSIPHRAERPIEAIAICLLLCLLLLTLMPKRWMMVGCGMILGGTIGNLIDLTVDGVVWDMIPLPDSIYANLADLFILSGIITVTTGLILHFISLCRESFFLAPKDRESLN